VYVGVDAHKHSVHVAVHSDRRELLTTWVQPADPATLSAALVPIRRRIARVVYEAGPTGFGLARRLTADGYPVEVIAPSKVLAARRPRPEKNNIARRFRAGSSVTAGSTTVGQSPMSHLDSPGATALHDGLCHHRCLVRVCRWTASGLQRLHVARCRDRCMPGR